MTFAESENVELKSEVTSDICKEIIAFANTHGGIIYVGVTDGGVPAGVANADEAMLRISNMVRDSIKPDVTRRRQRHNRSHNPARCGPPVLSCI